MRAHLKHPNAALTDGAIADNDIRLHVAMIADDDTTTSCLAMAGCDDFASPDPTIADHGNVTSRARSPVLRPVLAFTGSTEGGPREVRNIASPRSFFNRRYTVNGTCTARPRRLVRLTGSLTRDRDFAEKTRSRAQTIGSIVVSAALVIALVVVFVTSKTSKNSAKGTTSSTTTPANGLLTNTLQDMSSSNCGLAVVGFESVLKIAPHNKYTLYNIGYVDQLQNRVTDAEDEYQLALNTDPRYEPALYNLGFLHAASGDTTTAIAFYQRAISSNRQHERALQSWAPASTDGKDVRRQHPNPNPVGLNSALARAAAAQGVPGIK